MAALRTLVLLGLLGFVAAECPNACSGHGDCTAYDKCLCYRNWQAADCSQRTCPFGKAHVDVPKGDLDGSFSLDDLGTKESDTDTVEVVDVYGTWGTTEKFPLMVNSEGELLSNTAHWYVECSSKGLCDRKTGLCKCFTGYEGSSCQRASCPNDCSGHGTCQTIETIAKWDHDNVYKLWDRDMTMGCYCDPGYTGADCSLRQCKVGIDPLYTNLYTTANLASWRIKFNITAGEAESNIVGTYAIKFYDAYGEDYITDPIVHQQTDYSSAVEAALLALPNNIVPAVEVNYTTYNTFAEFAITFTKNPGQLKQIEVLTHLDGDRATLYDALHSTTGNIRAVDVDVFNDGAPGEYTDYFTNFCEGVTAYVTNSALGYTTDNGKFHYAAKLQVTSSYQARLLKQCLGDSDGNTLNNVDVENWDTGAHQLTTSESANFGSAGVTIGRYPHALKLVKQSRADVYDSGHVYLAWYSNDTSVTATTINGASVVFELNLLSRHPITHSANTPYYVFTTDAIVEKVMYDEDQDGDFSGWEDGPIVAWWQKYSNVLYTNVDASCENVPYLSSGKKRVSNCISKGDLIFLPAGYFGNDRSPSAHTYDTGYVGGLVDGLRVYESIREYTGMVYTVTKVWTEPASTLTATVEDRFRIQVDKNINWDGSQLGDPWGNAHDNSASAFRTGYQQIFKFTPETGYTYVSECANRGVCDRTTGLCTCFKGYTNDNCDTQSALAV